MAAASAERRFVPQGDAFIAPAPVEVAETPAPMSRTAKPAAADPFAEAALANGGRTPQRQPVTTPSGLELSPEDHREPVKERSSGLDLFKRVTGLGSLRRPAAPAKPAAQPSMTAPAPAKSELLVKEPARAPQQMAGVNPSERPQPARQEDDLLDIPSFLRRQAN
jgi:cell division protein FtsZ